MIDALWLVVAVIAGLFIGLFLGRILESLEWHMSAHSHHNRHKSGADWYIVAPEDGEYFLKRKEYVGSANAKLPTGGTSTAPPKSKRT